MLGTNIAGIVIVVIIIIAVFIAGFSHTPNTYEESKFKVFLTVLAGLGVFVTFFFYYNVVELQYQQQTSITYDNINHLNDNIAQLYMKGIDGSWEIIPKFIASIIPTMFSEDDLNSLEDEDSEKATLHKYLVSQKVFFLWRDYISYYVYIIKGNNNILAYLTMFLQRAHSKYLQEIWEVSKNEYNSNVIILGDLLFEYAKDVEDGDYKKIACKLVNDKKYINLVDSL